MDIIAPLAIGHFQMPVLEPHPEAHHAEYVLSYIEAGELNMDHGDRLTLKAGSVVIVPAGVPHRLRGGRNLSVWHLAFCPQCLGLNETQAMMAPFRQVRLGALPVARIASERRTILTQYCTELQRMIDDDARSSDDLKRSLLSLILAEVDRAMLPVTVARKSLVADALDYIQRHCCEPLSLAQVAQSVHRSPAYVTDRVKQATGASVGEWIISNRLHHACSRLLHTRAPVAQIAEQVGWQDVTHFIRQFKKHMGMTPGAWRRSQQAQDHTPATD
ncbi:MAG: AraC family transcriptional regulator [Saccharospirillum sp.]|uniref:helix-turn-helix domain-containing protein n=1 Tax=Saccharospirillum sp. TaxID=2033801 RepID=UPI003299380B